MGQAQPKHSQPTPIQAHDFFSDTFSSKTHYIAAKNDETITSLPKTTLPITLSSNQTRLPKIHARLPIQHIHIVLLVHLLLPWQLDAFLEYLIITSPISIKIRPRQCNLAAF
jgi:hypothetical protein